MEKLVYGIFAFVVISLLILVYVYLDKYIKAENQVTFISNVNEQVNKELGVVTESLQKEKDLKLKSETYASTLKDTLEHERKQHELDIDVANKALDAKEEELKNFKLNSVLLGDSADKIDTLGFGIYAYLRALNMKHSEIIEGQYFSNTFNWEERYNKEYEILKASQVGSTPPDDGVNDISNLFEDADAAYKSMDKAINGHLDSEPIIAELTDEALEYKSKEMKSLKGKAVIIGTEVTGGVTKKRASRKKEDKTTK